MVSISIHRIEIMEIENPIQLESSGSWSRSISIKTAEGYHTISLFADKKQDLIFK